MQRIIICFFIFVIARVPTIACSSDSSLIVNEIRTTLLTYFENPNIDCSGVLKAIEDNRIDQTTPVLDFHFAGLEDSKLIENANNSVTLQWLLIKLANSTACTLSSNFVALKTYLRIICTFKTCDQVTTNPFFKILKRTALKNNYPVNESALILGMLKKIEKGWSEDVIKGPDSLKRMLTKIVTLQEESAYLAKKMLEEPHTVSTLLEKVKGLEGKEQLFFHLMNQICKTSDEIKTLFPNT